MFSQLYLYHSSFNLAPFFDEEPIKSSDHPKIPKIIHQVWLGDKELPSLYQKYQQEWKDSYPDFEYKLWTEKEIEQLDFDSKDLYKKTSSYVEKSDVLRYAILNKFGGIYVDFDVEPRGNFAELLYKYDFFATLEPAYRQFKVNPSMNGGFMGASANNPILYEAIRILRVNFDHYDDFENSVYRAMFPLGEAFLSQYHKLDHVLVFPVTYTQPTMLKRSLSSGYLKKLYRRFFDDCHGGGFSDFKPETIVFHNIRKE